MTDSSEKRAHFIRQLITDDLASGKHQSVVTRFPPEPNGYLHIGHAKSICLNFGLAEEFAGKCYLRFDDTNPIKEEEEFVNAIIDDVRWLGFEWCDMTHSSDYYQPLYDLAVILIEKELAYVDSLSMEEIRAYRGTLQEPGQESPYRTRSKEENLDLFARMKAGADVRSEATTDIADIALLFKKQMLSLSKQLQTNVTLKPGKKGCGSLVIHYDGEQNLEQLIERLIN